MDKLLHFLSGFFLATCLQFVGYFMPLIGIVAGALKEWYDSRHGGIWDWADFACTFAGSFVALWIWLIYELM